METLFNEEMLADFELQYGIDMCVSPANKRARVEPNNTVAEIVNEAKTLNTTKLFKMKGRSRKRLLEEQLRANNCGVRVVKSTFDGTILEPDHVKCNTVMQVVAYMDSDHPPRSISSPGARGVGGVFTIPVCLRSEFDSLLSSLTLTRVTHLRLYFSCPSHSNVFTDDDVLHAAGFGERDVKMYESCGRVIFRITQS